MANNEIEVIPCEVAEIIFNDEPNPAKSYQLFCYSDTTTKTENVDIFEIFLTILMEGLFIKYSPITSETLKTFTPDIILILQPWFHSLGFNVSIDTVNKSEIALFDQYYCKITLRCDPSWSTYYEIHENIEKDYHFIFGGNSPFFKDEHCNLENLFALFITHDKAHKISFNLI